MATKKDTDPAAELDVDDLRRLLAENEELRAKLADTQEELAETVAELDEHRPTVAWPGWANADEVRAHFGESHLRYLAEEWVVTEDRKRTKDGKPSLWKDNAQWERLVESAIPKVIDELIRDVTKYTQGVAKGEHRRLRTLKMVTPDGRLVQTPQDVVHNNNNGSLGDGILRYKRKGFKLPDPPRCPLVDCWQPSAFEAGEWLWGGYCSKLHRDYIEGAEVRVDSDGSRITYHSVRL